MAHQAVAYLFLKHEVTRSWDANYTVVFCRATPSIKFTSMHLYTWVERGTVRAKCVAQNHNAVSLARARTWTAGFRAQYFCMAVLQT